MHPLHILKKHRYAGYMAAIVGCILLACVGFIFLARLPNGAPPNISGTHTAVAVQISGMIRRYSTATAVARVQTAAPAITPNPTPTSISSPVAAPPPAIDWEGLPVIGYIIINLRALAGGGNELIVGLVVGLATLLLTQLRNIIKFFSNALRMLFSLVRGHSKDGQFAHNYLEWLISQHRYLGLLPAQIVARRWGEQQQFVELEKIYVRLSLSSQAGDEQWANFDTDDKYRWRKIPGWLLKVSRVMIGKVLFNESIFTYFFVISIILVSLIGLAIGSWLGARINNVSGNLPGAAIGVLAGIFGYYLFYLKYLIGNRKERLQVAWLVSDAPYKQGSLGLVVDRYPRLILRGDPGSGKSTLLRYMAVTCARALRNDRTDNDSSSLVRNRLQWDHPPFPILVRLNRHTKVVNWSSDRGLIDAIRDELPPDLRKKCPDGFFERCLKNRPCLILLDAFDELGSPVTRAVMADYIEGFLDAHGKPIHRMVVTTRIMGYEGQLDRLGFHIRTVQPLQDGEVRALIKQRFKGFALIETSGRTSSAARAAEQKLTDRAEKLIEKVERLPNLRQLATNPLLLSLITLVSYLKVELPEERILLYRDCVEILTERWTEYKQIESGAKVSSSHTLSLNQKICILRDLAFAMQQHRGSNQNQALISKAEACDLIASRLSELIGASLSKNAAVRKSESHRLAESWLESVQAESGILVAQGLDYDGETLIGFSHLTFQEYLTAIAIKEMPQYWKMLQKNLFDPAWYEVVLLYAVLMEDATPLIQALLKAPEQPAGILLAGHCLAEKVHKIDQGVLAETLERLKGLFLADDPKLIERIGEIFGAIGSVDLIEELRKAIRDDFPIRQLAAIRALRHIHAADVEIMEVRQELVSILDDRYPLDVKIAASETLAEIGDPRFVNFEPVMVAITSPKPNFANREQSFFRAIDDYVYAISLKLVKHIFRYDESFEISRYPVTNVEYSCFVDETNHATPPNWIEGIYPHQKASHPVQGIEKQSAHAYCQWLSHKTGKAYRIPTEWEWEFAAAGPDDADYPWGDDFDPSKCNTLESGKEDTTPVGAYFDVKSQAGLQDTCGNVQEISFGLCGNPSTLLDATPHIFERLITVFGGVWGVGVISLLTLLFIAGLIVTLLGIGRDNLLWIMIGIGITAVLAMIVLLGPVVSFWMYVLSNGNVYPIVIGKYEKGGAWNLLSFRAKRNYRIQVYNFKASGFRIVRVNHQDYLQRLEPIYDKTVRSLRSFPGSMLGMLMFCLIFIRLIGLDGFYKTAGSFYEIKGNIRQAVEYQARATRINPKDAFAWNSVCWYGSLIGYDADLMQACETAVSLKPDDANIRDSRGVARALAGDYQGAIQDFEFFAQNYSGDEKSRLLRMHWIAALKLGNNPIDQNTLQLLLKIGQLGSSKQEILDQLLSRVPPDDGQWMVDQVQLPENLELEFSAIIQCRESGDSDKLTQAFFGVWAVRNRKIGQVVSSGKGNIIVQDPQGIELGRYPVSFAMGADTIGWLMPEQNVKSRVMIGQPYTGAILKLEVNEVIWKDLHDKTQAPIIQIDIDHHGMDGNPVYPYHRVVFKVHNLSQRTLKDVQIFAVVNNSQRQAVDMLSSGSGYIKGGENRAFEAKSKSRTGRCLGKADDKGYFIQYWIWFLTEENDMVEYYADAKLPPPQ